MSYPFTIRCLSDDDELIPIVGSGNKACICLHCRSAPPHLLVHLHSSSPYLPLDNITASRPPAVVADLRSPYTLLSTYPPPRKQERRKTLDSLPLPATSCNNINNNTLCYSSSFSFSFTTKLGLSGSISSHSLSLSLPQTCNLELPCRSSAHKPIECGSSEGGVRE